MYVNFLITNQVAARLFTVENYCSVFGYGLDLYGEKNPEMERDSGSEFICSDTAFRGYLFQLLRAKDLNLQAGKSMKRIASGTETEKKAH